MDQSKKIYCLIRKEWVLAYPEEKVRQNLLFHLIRKLKFPEALVAVEKSLMQMPHISSMDAAIPRRRADIICFGKGLHPSYDLYPLLLIECKAVKITRQVISQVVGYNHFMKAYFIAVSNMEETRVGWFDPVKKDYQFIPHIPTYTQLLEAVPKTC